MKIEKMPSGSYRIRQMYKGTRYTITLDHKPSQKEATLLMAEKMQNVDTTSGASMTFDKALEEYINIKCNVLSPGTIREYKRLRNKFSDGFKNINIYDMTPTEIQKEVNDYSVGRSPKTTANFSGLISAVMGIKRPNLIIRTTLPQKVEKEAIIPAHGEVIQILEALKGTPYYIPIQLACLGLRRSEIIALTVDDLNGNTLTINKARVINENNKYVNKTTKTTASARSIYIPDELVDEIKETGYIYNMYPGNILKALHRTQDKLGVPRCKLHELRHFYVSYAHSVGMSDADIIKSIGHKTDAVMKRVYRHAMNVESEQNRVANSIFK